MRWLLFVLLLVAQQVHATMIPVGYHSRLVRIWRYFERNDSGSFTPRMLVYNVTDTPVTVEVRVVKHGGDMTADDLALLTKQTGLMSDVEVRLNTIPAHGYGIYTTAQVAEHVSSGYFEAVIINGWGAGIQPLRQRLVWPDKRYKYYAYECINGVGGGGYMLGTNTLMATVGDTCHMTIYYSNVEARRKNAFNVTLWQYEMKVNKGAAWLSLADPKGQAWTVTTASPYVHFVENIVGIDSLQLELAYGIQLNDPMPELELRESFCMGCMSVVLLPVFPAQ
jgi:hypothetical protein